MKSLATENVETVYTLVNLKDEKRVAKSYSKNGEKI